MLRSDSLAELIASAKAMRVGDAERSSDFEALAAEHLDVYATKSGQWNPVHGDLEIPAGWEFLSSGDAFLTRTVKASGTYWLSWQPRSRNRQHRRLLGLWAPSQVIAAAQVRADETAERRAAKRVVGAQSRGRQEDRNRLELESAIARFLAFAPAHQELQQRIAKESALHAAVVGSGRVGRTRKLTVGDRAALSARAYIRHSIHELPRRSRCSVAGALGRGVLVSRDQRDGERSGRPLPLRASPHLKLLVVPDCHLVGANGHTLRQLLVR